MSTKSKSESKRKPGVITEAQLEAAKNELISIHWEQKRKQSHTSRALDYLSAEIKAGRAAGVSWPGIAEVVNKTLGTNIHPATIRSYFKKEALTEKEIEQIERKGGDAIDLSQDKHTQTPEMKQ